MSDKRGRKKVEEARSFVNRKFCNSKCWGAWRKITNEWKRRALDAASRSSAKKQKHTARLNATTQDQESELRAKLRRDVLSVAKNLSG